jgi:predicted Zn-dependent protease
MPGQVCRSSDPDARVDLQPATGTLAQALAHATHLLAREPALACTQLDAILQAAPGHPDVLHLLAAARAACDDLAGALEILAPLARQHPQSAPVLRDYGAALARMGQAEHAAVVLRHAATLEPDLPEVWRELADCLDATGDRDAAAAAYLQHVEHAAHDPELMSAAAALVANRIPEAETGLRTRLRRAPTDVAAIRMLAEVAARIGRSEDAQTLLERCLELAPDFFDARSNLALVLHRANQPERALAEVDRLLAVRPGDPAAGNLKAAILCRTGDYAQAIDLYAQLVQLETRNPKLWLSYGHALKTAGHTERAIAAYRHAIQLEPAFGEAWWSLANLKTCRFSASDVQMMQRELVRPGLAETNRLHLEFALGKATEDAGNFAASFGHYARGNAIRRAQVGYAADDTTARVDYVRTHYTPEFFAARAGAGSPARDPIFVVGLPRAGSTLVEQILSSHGAIEGTMELPEITSITRVLRAQGDADAPLPYHAALAALDAGALRALGERYLARTRIQRKTAAPYFIDKMPNNFAHIGLLHLMLPNAKIIDVRRHPMACGFSIFKQHFARGQDFSYSLADIGRYYRDYVALMAHFDRVLPGRIHRVVYEHLIADTEGEVRRLLAYCGLPFEAGCLRFFENPRAVRTASSEQVRQPIYRAGLEHWRHYAAWLGELEAAVGPEILRDYPRAPA